MQRFTSVAVVFFLFCQIGAAQISVETKNVKTVIKTTQTIVTQVVGDDGQPILPPTTSTGATRVADGKSAVLMQLNTTRPIPELLIKPRCRTAKVMQVEPGLFLVTEPGKHEIEFNAIGQDPLSWDDTTITVEVGGQPDSDDDSDEEPEVGANFRLLIVEETALRTSLPTSQLAIFSSPLVRQYLNEKCVRVQGQPDWRIWDRDTDVSGCNTELCEMLKKERGAELPWLILSNDKSSFSGPLPADVEKFLGLVRKYGG